MRAIGLPLIALMLVLVAGCGDDDGSATTTPTAAPTASGATRAAPWTSTNAPAIDAGVIPSGQNAAWLVINPETREQTSKPPIEGHVPQALAGGRYDIATTQTGLGRLDAQSGTLTDIGAGWSGEVSLDGAWAAVIPEVEGPTLAVVNVNSGERFDLGQLGKPVELDWGPDDTLAIIKDSSLYLAQAPNWSPTLIGSFNPPNIAWSPNSQKIVAYADGVITLWNRDLSGQRSLALVGGMSGTPVAWSSDGKKLAWGDENGWWVTNVEGGGLTNVSPVELGGASGTAVWSPDGTQLAFPVASKTWSQYGIGVASADGSGGRLLVSGGQLEVLGWTNEGVILRVFSGL